MMAVTLIVSVPGCVLLPRGDEAAAGRARTDDSITVLRRGIHGYERSHSALPESLRQLCPTMRSEDCDWLVPGWSYEDGWGTILAYRKTAGSYEIRSAGADRRFYTGDDIVVDRSEEREAAAEHAGCYQLTSPVRELHGVHLILSSAEKSIGWFQVETGLPGYHEPRWRTTDGQIQVYWMKHHSALRLMLTPTETGLRGFAAHVAGTGHPRSGVEVTVRRITCGAAEVSAVGDQ